jgi:hypothetical protein
VTCHPGAQNMKEGLRPRTDLWSSGEESDDSVQSMYWVQLAQIRKEREQRKASKVQKKADHLAAVVVTKDPKEAEQKAAAANQKVASDDLALATERKKKEEENLKAAAAQRKKVATEAKKKGEENLKAAVAQRKKVATEAKKKEEENLIAAAAQRKEVLEAATTQRKKVLDQLAVAAEAKKQLEDKLEAAAAHRKKVLDDLAVATEEKKNKEDMLKAQTKSTGKRSQSTINPDVSAYICTVHCHRREDLIAIPPHEVKAYLKADSTYDTTVLLATSNCSQCSKSAKDIANNVSIHRCIDCQKEMEATLADDNSIGGRRFPWMCGACYSSGASGSSRRRKKWSKHQV